MGGLKHFYFWTGLLLLFIASSYIFLHFSIQLLHTFLDAANPMFNLLHFLTLGIDVFAEIFVWCNELLVFGLQSGILGLLFIQSVREDLYWLDGIIPSWLYLLYLPLHRFGLHFIFLLHLIQLFDTFIVLLHHDDLLLIKRAHALCLPITSCTILILS